MTDRQRLVRILAANPFFGRFDGDALGEFAALCVTRSLVAGEVLFLKGDPGDALFVVRRGQIEIGLGTGEGRRLGLNLLGPGDVFGEIALLDGRARTADATASEAAELHVLRRRDLLDLLTRRPELSIRMIELLCDRLRWVSDRAEERALQPLPVRLARRLILLAEDYGAEVEISQDRLADLVGAARETVNRQLQEWRRGGLVELGRAKVRITGQAALAALSRGD